jgi:5-methyltetrahydrofolate--homocysteine methyltransferase
LAHNTSFNISAHPNAGLPNAFGIRRNTEQMQVFIKEYLDDNLINIIGGCCGTTPEHIKLIADIAKDYKPRGASGVIEYYYDSLSKFKTLTRREIKILMMSDFL